MKSLLPAAALMLMAGTPGEARTPAPLPPPPAVFKQAPVVFLMDIGADAVLYGEQADLRFVPASMTKVMTAHLAFELMRQGRLKPADRYVVRQETARQWRGKGTSLFLQPGESVPVTALLHGIVTVSANDASVVLAEGFAGDVPTWTGLMNAEARRLGMTNSHFATPNGWPDGGATYVSARDLARLSNALIERHPREYRTYFGQKRFTWNGVTRESRDPTVGVVAGADGIKTGYTREAGYNFLGSAERDGRRLVMVVAGAKSEAQRAEISRELLEWGFSEWRKRELFPANTRVGTALVQDGVERSVGLVTPRAVYVVGRKGATAGMPAGGLKIRYNGPIVAPIAAGAEIARLEVWNGATPTYVPLHAARSVEKAGMVQRLLNGLAGLFA